MLCLKFTKSPMYFPSFKLRKLNWIEFHFNKIELSISICKHHSRSNFSQTWRNWSNGATTWLTFGKCLHIYFHWPKKVISFLTHIIMSSLSCHPTHRFIWNLKKSFNCHISPRKPQATAMCHMSLNKRVLLVQYASSLV